VPRKKLKYAIGGLLLAGIIIGVLFSVGSENLTYYYTPAEALNAISRLQNERIRIMGLVDEGSVDWVANETRLTFRLIDETHQAVTVAYFGVKPDMFREGQGVVVEGKLSASGLFQASALLVKHNEEYKITDHTDKKNSYLKTLQ